MNVEFNLATWALLYLELGFKDHLAKHTYISGKVEKRVEVSTLKIWDQQGKVNNRVINYWALVIVENNLLQVNAVLWTIVLLVKVFALLFA